MGKAILKIKATSLVYNSTANETYKDNVFIDDKYLEDFGISKVQIYSDSDNNDVINELLSDNNEKPQEYSGAGVPFIGANRYQLDDYEEYGNEKETKINKNMVAGVIALSLLLVTLLVMSGMMIYSFSKGNSSTYKGIIDTPPVSYTHLRAH